MGKVFKVMHQKELHIFGAYPQNLQKFRSCWQLRFKPELTHIHGCFKASEAVILLEGLTVNMLFIRLFASGVTVSHSGDGY